MHAQSTSLDQLVEDCLVKILGENNRAYDQARSGLFTHDYGEDCWRFICFHFNFGLTLIELISHMGYFGFVLNFILWEYDLRVKVAEVVREYLSFNIFAYGS